MADPIALDNEYSISAGESALLSEIKKGIIFNGTTFVFANTDTGLLGNDSDADGDNLSVASVSDGVTSTVLASDPVTVTGDDGVGLFTITSDGQISFDASSGYEYLAEGEEATVSLTYTVSDGNGGEATATVTVTVTGMDGDGVSASGETFATDQDTAISSALGELLTNDTSFDGNHTILELTDALGSNGGLFSIAADGTLSFDPNGDFASVALGETAETSVTYTVIASNGETAEATATVTVTGLNEDPTAADDGYTITAGESLQLSELEQGIVFNGITYVFANTDTRLLVNDSDVDGDALSITKVSDGVTETALNGAAVTVLADDGIGSFTISPDGTISFDASSGYAYLREAETTVASITYTVSDGNGGEATATASVTVAGVDGDQFDITPDEIFVDEDGSEAINLDGWILNDISDEGEVYVPGELSGVSGTNGGLFGIDGNGDISFDTNGDFNYLSAGEIVQTSFDIPLEATNGETEVTSVSAVVTGVNDLPVAADDVYTIVAGETAQLGEYYYQLEFTGVTFEFVKRATRLLDNDSDVDANDNLVITEVDGVAMVDGEVVVVGSNGGVFTISEDGSFVFDAATGEFDSLKEGNSIFTAVGYTISDGNGGTASAVATVEVLGEAPNESVIANDDSAIISEDASSYITISPLDNDQDLNPLDTFSISSIDTSGLIGELLDNGDGTFDYRANGEFESLDQGGLGSTSFSYTIVGSDGTTDTATVSIQVNGENDAPVATNVFGLNVAENGTLDIDVTSFIAANTSDVDSNATLTLSDFSSTSNSGALVSFDTLSDTLTYDPNGQFDYLDGSSTTGDSFGYTIEDEYGASASGIVVLTVIGVDDPIVP